MAQQDAMVLRAQHETQRRDNIPGKTLLPRSAIVAVLVAWELFVRWRGIAPIFSAGAELDRASICGACSPTAPWNINLGVTLLRIFVGFALPPVTGIALGLLMGMSRIVCRIADLWIAALYPLPKISLIPLLIIWLGTGEAYQIVISAITAFFPIVISTYSGIRQVDRGLIKAAQDLGASRRQIQFKVVIPAAMPSIFAGLQLGMGVTIILIVAAEMIGGSSQSGMGYLLISAGQVMETEKVFAALMVLAVDGSRYHQAAAMDRPQDRALDRRTTIAESRPEGDRMKSTSSLRLIGLALMCAVPLWQRRRPPMSCASPTDRSSPAAAITSRARRAISKSSASTSSTAKFIDGAAVGSGVRLRRTRHRRHDRRRRPVQQRGQGRAARDHSRPRPQPSGLRLHGHQRQPGALRSGRPFAGRFRQAEGQARRRRGAWQHQPIQCRASRSPKAGLDPAKDVKWTVNVGSPT